MIFRWFLLFFLGYRGIVHPPSDDEGTERTWFKPEQRPRKNAFLSDQSTASNPRKGQAKRFGRQEAFRQPVKHWCIKLAALSAVPRQLNPVQTACCFLLSLKAF